MSDSLCPHGLHHTRLPYPSPAPEDCSNLYPSSRWCHPTSHPLSSPSPLFLASGSFPVSQLFTSGGQNIGSSASASVLPMNIQGVFPLRWTGLISLLSKELSRIFSKPTVQKHQFFEAQLFFMVQLSHPYMAPGETIALMRQTFVGTVMSLLFNILSRFVIAFLPGNKCLIVSWLQSPSAVIF